MTQDGDNAGTGPGPTPPPAGPVLPPVRILHDPALEAPPDFSSPVFSAAREGLVASGNAESDADAGAALLQAWEADRRLRCTRWEDQVRAEADGALEEERKRMAERRVKEAAEAAKVADSFPALIKGRVLPAYTELPVRIQVINALKRQENVPLYWLLPEGRKALDAESASQASGQTRMDLLLNSDDGSFSNGKV